MAAAATAATAEIGASVAAASSEMEATATSINPAAAAAVGPSPAIEKNMHKNHLHSFAVQKYKKPPIYKVEFESDGKLLQFKFRCTVEVGGQQFSSAGSFGRKKEAEQDAARVAYEALTAVAEDEIKQAIKEALGLIDQDVVFCKSILQEFAVKTKKKWPSYSVAFLIKPLNLFAATVEFDGESYTGESARNKKGAEQNAACAVIKSILAKHNTCMAGIIISKKQLITAVKSSGSTPATFTPIQFTRPVSHAAYGEPDHVALLLQNASSTNPSSANVGRSKSKKRKGTSQ